MRVALFATCFNETLFPETPRAVVELLEELGHDVVFPTQQTCCGQMHANSGYGRDARRLADRMATVFAGFDAVVSPSASCVGHVREATGLPVYELTEFIVDILGIEDVGARLEMRAVYHPTCHSLRGLRLGERPKRLLRHVRGLELLELDGDDQCCGFGGTFAVKNAAVSTAMLSDKLAAIHRTGANLVIAVDNSCLMHIGGGARRAELPFDVKHLAEVLTSR